MKTGKMTNTKVNANINTTLKSLMANMIFLFGLFIVIFVLIKVGVLNSYYEGILTNIMIYIILAVSLNLTTGFLGQLALGHAGFMAIGAYSSAIITKAVALPMGVSFPIAILAGGLLAGFIGVLIGIPALRLKGDYLAIITLGFGEIIKNILLNLSGITGGAEGLSRIPQYTGFSIAFWIMVVTVVIFSNLIRSRHGRAIISIREDEIAAEASGINTTFYKIFAFAFAAFFAGVAGALFSHTLPIIVPGKFDYNYSIEMVIMVVLGGMGNITSSVLSAIFLISLPQLLSSLSKYRMLIYSILLILIMMFKPSGLFGNLTFSVTGILDKLKVRKDKKAVR